MSRAEYFREWRKNNKDKVSKSNRKRYLKNKDYWKQYRKENKDKLTKYISDWQKNNKEKYNAKASKYRNKKYDQTPELTKAEQHEIEILYHWAQILPGDWHVDHIIPLSKGGLHHPDNLCVIPAQQNISKYNIMPEEFYGRWYNFLIGE